MVVLAKGLNSYLAKRLRWDASKKHSGCTHCGSVIWYPIGETGKRRCGECARDYTSSSGTKYASRKKSLDEIKRLTTIIMSSDMSDSALATMLGVDTRTIVSLRLKAVEP
mgnify:FL=1